MMRLSKIWVSAILILCLLTLHTTASDHQLKEIFQKPMPNIVNMILDYLSWENVQKFQRVDQAIYTIITPILVQAEVNFCECLKHARKQNQSCYYGDESNQLMNLIKYLQHFEIYQNAPDLQTIFPPIQLEIDFHLSNLKLTFRYDIHTKSWCYMCTNIAPDSNNLKLPPVFEAEFQENALVFLLDGMHKKSKCVMEKLHRINIARHLKGMPAISPVSFGNTIDFLEEGFTGNAFPGEYGVIRLEPCFEYKMKYYAFGKDINAFICKNLLNKY